MKEPVKSLSFSALCVRETSLLALMITLTHLNFATSSGNAFFPSDTRTHVDVVRDGDMRNLLRTSSISFTNSVGLNFVMSFLFQV